MRLTTDLQDTVIWTEKQIEVHVEDSLVLRHDITSMGKWFRTFGGTAADSFATAEMHKDYVLCRRCFEAT
jgi:hypothetical protein